MAQSVGIAVFAAGKGKRLPVRNPKPLVPLCGRALVDFPLSESMAFAQGAGLVGHPLVVTGYCREEVEGYVRRHYGDQVQFALQQEQLGTADALKAYFAADPQARERDFTLVLCADTPLIRREDLQQLYRVLQGDEACQAVAGVFRADNPYGYGRIVDDGGFGFHIVEEREADDDTQKITTVNSGLYLFRTLFLLQHLFQIEARKGGESYLTDLFQDHLPVKAVFSPKSTAFLGVNTIEQLANAERLIRQEINQMHQAQGVYICDPRHTYIDWGVQIGEGSTIHPLSFISQGSKLGAQVVVEPFCTIKATEIRNRVEIKNSSYLEGALVREGATVGPFARIRPGSDVGEGARVGNFVELKQAKLGAGVKASHLSYIGDAEIGEGTNIGCGFITCNYDGNQKHKTTIGKHAFIGSDSQTVAPVTIGDGAYIGSGSTINRDVPSEAFAVARAKQVTREGMAMRFNKSEKVNQQDSKRTTRKPLKKPAKNLKGS